jgi:hypothetical protein
MNIELVINAKTAYAVELISSKTAEFLRSSKIEFKGPFSLPNTFIQGDKGARSDKFYGRSFKFEQNDLSGFKEEFLNLIEGSAQEFKFQIGIIDEKARNEE